MHSHFPIFYNKYGMYGKHILLYTIFNEYLEKHDSRCLQ